MKFDPGSEHLMTWILFQEHHDERSVQSHDCIGYSQKLVRKPSFAQIGHYSMLAA